MMGQEMQDLVRRNLPCGHRLGIEFLRNDPENQSEKLDSTDTNPTAHYDVLAMTRFGDFDTSTTLEKSPDCRLDVMDLDGFPMETLVLGKDWMER